MKLIKRYPNRRLYDTEIKGYITLADVRTYIKSFCSFEVIDSKTGKDLTRQVLLQVLTDIESEGHASVLTNKMLEGIVRLYDTQFSGVMGQHLELSILAFMDQQTKWQNEMDNLNPTKAFEDYFKQFKPPE
mgnify:CR=1 FL=1|jgi:polyhydroxyalkanoate synthesis repressor PhaR